MPTSAHTSPEDWARWQPILEKKYLIDDETCPEVKKYLHANGFLVTERMLKAKFCEWGWLKKLTKDRYAAMTSVVKNVGPVEFLVPKRGATFVERIDCKKLHKEVRRKNTTKLSKNEAPLPIPDLEVARETLRKAGITWRPLNAADSGSHSVPSRPRTTTKRQIHTKRRSGNFALRNTDQENHDHSDSSTFDETTNETPDLVVDSARELNRRNFGPLYYSEQFLNASHAAATFEQPTLPFKSAWLVDLHDNLFPHRQEYQIMSPILKMADRDGQFPLAPSEPTFDFWDFTEIMAAIAPGQANPRLTLQETAIAKALGDHYRTYDGAGHRHKVMQFSAYWVGQLLAGRATPDDYKHVSRVRARESLHMMLDELNMELLPACYWITSIITSFDRPRLLLAFFEDCIDCIETNSSYLGSILQPWIRFMVIRHDSSDSNYEPRSHRLQKGSLEIMRMNFDACSELQQSIDNLERNGKLRSTTGLILGIYRAWDILQEDCQRGLYEMIECSKQSATMFGVTHLVTIQCTSMVAEGYKRMNNSQQAKCDLDLVLHHLTPCSRILTPLYYRSLLQRAMLFMDLGQLTEAHDDLKLIFNFHLQTFGAQSPLTWEAAEQFFLTLERQGFADEAQQRRADLRDQYEQQWKKHPVRH